MDFEARYKVDGYDGIAWRLDGYATEWLPEQWISDEDPEDEEAGYWQEPEEIEDRSKVIAVMVGDNRRFTFDIEDVTVIPDDAYCHECGQIGCTMDGRS